MIVQDVNALASVMDGGDRALRRRWLANAALTIVGDFGLVYCQILALQRQTAGEPYVREALMYVLAIVLWLFTSRRLWDRTGLALAEGAQALSDRIVERLHRLPLHRFEALGRGTIMLRLTVDASRVANAAQPLLGVVTAFIRFGFGAVFAISVSADAGGLAMAAMLLMGAAIAAQLQVMRDGFGRVAGDEVRMYDLLRGYVAGVIQIKLHAPRAESIGRAFSVVSDRMRAARVSIFALFFERKHGAAAALFGILGINVFLLPLVISVDSRIIIEINLVLVWVAFSVFGFVFKLPELGNTADALERLQDLDAQLAEEGLEPAVDPATIAQRRFEDFQTLAVHGLRFHYPKSSERPGFAAGPIDLTFRRGEVVFIIGRNGSGKSTFLKMLTGLYPAEAGGLSIDGSALDRDAMAHYRELFGTIFTDHHIFARVFGVSGAAQRRAEALLEEMQIAHKTVIAGGRVTNRDLSTGQRKRLAMVLARLQDRPIMIFDEWAADQDPEFRAIYYREILPSLAAAGKLVIAVTHDDQYFDCADRAIHFHAGQVRPDPEDQR